MNINKPLQVAGCFEALAATVRSADRERYEREMCKPQVVKTPQQLRAEQWAAEYKAEQEVKEKADRDAIARDSLKILPDGTRVESFSGFRRN